MTNNYEKPDAVELGKAQNEILGEKDPDDQTDNLGVMNRTYGLTLDDFDE